MLRLINREQNHKLAFDANVVQRDLSKAIYFECDRLGAHFHMRTNKMPSEAQSDKSKLRQCLRPDSAVPETKSQEPDTEKQLGVGLTTIDIPWSVVSLVLTIANELGIEISANAATDLHSVRYYPYHLVEHKESEPEPPQIKSLFSSTIKKL